MSVGACQDSAAHRTSRCAAALLLGRRQDRCGCGASNCSAKSYAFATNSSGLGSLATNSGVAGNGGMIALTASAHALTASTTASWPWRAVCRISSCTSCAVVLVLVAVMSPPLVSLRSLYLAPARYIKQTECAKTLIPGRSRPGHRRTPDDARCP